MMQPLLELKCLSVCYGVVEAVHQVDLVVNPGEIVTVIGPNGAGKSTLLSAAMGLLPSSGEIWLNGGLIRRPTVQALVADQPPVFRSPDAPRWPPDESPGWRSCHPPPLPALSAQVKPLKRRARQASHVRRPM